MLDRVTGGVSRRSPKRSVPLGCESLEGRQLLAASLATIPTVSVPATLGTQVPLNGSGSVNPQTFTVTSSNPDVKATVAQGQFLTLTISHKAANASDIAFGGQVTFQLFGDLTPNTVKEIVSLVQSGFYTQPSPKIFHRVASGFPGTGDFILQGGSSTGTGAGNSGQPGTPFIDEFSLQDPFTGQGQLAMANAGPDTNDTQFFITTGSPRFLDFKHTIFGQVVADPSGIINAMTKVALTTDPLSGAQTKPLSDIAITNAAVTTANPNGVIHIDTTKSTPNETSTIAVTATDPTTKTTASQSFTVNVAANTQNERAFLAQLPYTVSNKIGTATNPEVGYLQSVGQNQADLFQVQGVDAENDQLSYIVKGDVVNGAFTNVQNVTSATVSATGVVNVTPLPGFSGTINFLVGVRDQTNRAGTGSTGTQLPIDDPSNFDWHRVQLTVNSTGTPVALTPIAESFSQTATANTPQLIALHGISANPATSTGLTFAIVTQPTHGTITQFNASTGIFTYTPQANFSGSDSIQYTVTDNTGAGASLTSPMATVSINVSLGNTGAVRQVGNVLVVTPVPRTDGGTNDIKVSQTTDPTGTANDKIQVTVNGEIDAIQPKATDIDRIVVFGAKASDNITVDPSVDPRILVTLDGGHGGTNVLLAGAGPTREHGWFGKNTLTGGTGANQLVGRAGRVKFKPTATTNEIFAGVPHPGVTVHHERGNVFQSFSINPPGGTFFKFVNGRLVPTSVGKTPHAAVAARHAAIHPRAAAAKKAANS